MMNDIELYNACMDYCRVFGIVALHTIQYEKAKLVRDKYELEQMREHMRYDEERLDRRYNDLYNIINKK